MEFHQVCSKNRYSIKNLVYPFARKDKGFFVHFTLLKSEISNEKNPVLFLLLFSS